MRTLCWITTRGCGEPRPGYCRLQPARTGTSCRRSLLSSSSPRTVSERCGHTPPERCRNPATPSRWNCTYSAHGRRRSSPSCSPRWHTTTILGSPLGVGHTVNFGQPWLDASSCVHGLISLPYLDGPTLENPELPDGRVIKFDWLVPITPAEVQYKKHPLKSSAATPTASTSTSPGAGTRRCTATWTRGHRAPAVMRPRRRLLRGLRPCPATDPHPDTDAGGKPLRFPLPLRPPERSRVRFTVTLRVCHVPNVGG